MDVKDATCNAIQDSWARLGAMTVHRNNRRSGVQMRPSTNSDAQARYFPHKGII